MKNSNNTIGNRTRDLPACSAVPQPSAPPRASNVACTRVFSERSVFGEKSMFRKYRGTTDHPWICG
jgi:hypothetical protein